MAVPVYLDHNATAPIGAAAAVAMRDALALVGNPSSVHRFGRQARAAIETARGQVARLVGAAPAEVIFTSGGTEANALALSGPPVARLVVSDIEHESVLAAAAGRVGCEVRRVGVTPAGIIDLDALDRALAGGDAPTLVSVMWANNETGAIQPIDAVVRIARRHRALVHADAVQAVGRLALSFADSGLDLMTVSSHKIGGPAGAGALIARAVTEIRPLLAGGGQERGHRAGTENRLGIVGFGAAADAAADRAWLDRVRTLRDGFEERLRAAAADARILSADAPRLPNTSCVAMPGVSAETQVMAFDLDGIAVSAGAACSSGKVRRSHVIDAMDPGGDAAANAVRISFGPGNGPADVDRVLASWLGLHRRAVPGRCVA